MYDDGVTYMFIQHNNVYLMTASRQNCNAASIFLFLHRVVDVSAYSGLFNLHNEEAVLILVTDVIRI